MVGKILNNLDQRFNAYLAGLSPIRTFFVFIALFTVIGVGGIILGLIVLLGPMTIEYKAKSPTDRAHMMEFYKVLDLGMVEEDIWTAWSAKDRGRLELVEMGGFEHRTLCVKSPSYLGAEGWYLYLQVSDDKLVALRMRSLDSERHQPEGAPDDTATQDAAPLLP